MALGELKDRTVTEPRNSSNPRAKEKYVCKPQGWEAKGSKTNNNARGFA